MLNPDILFEDLHHPDPYKHGRIYATVSEPITLCTKSNFQTKEANSYKTTVIRLGVSTEMNNLDKSQYAINQFYNLTCYRSHDFGEFKLIPIKGHYAKLHNRVENGICYSGVFQFYDVCNIMYALDWFNRHTTELAIPGKYFMSCAIPRPLPKTAVEKVIALIVAKLCSDYNECHEDKYIVAGCYDRYVPVNHYHDGLRWFTRHGINDIESFIEYVKNVVPFKDSNKQMEMFLA